jgi:hypothetical protein
VEDEALPTGHDEDLEEQTDPTLTAEVRFILFTLYVYAMTLIY